MQQKRLVTGIKPTGDLHLGNLFTAIQPVVALQDEYEGYIFIADLHALNQRTDSEGLNRNILEIAKAYLACGLNPQKTALFQQSMLPHAELATMIGAQVGLGHLERAHAYKDAIAKGRAANFGLFSYPILMAADILLYQGEAVPVGKDQHQHLEIAREIAGGFNTLYGQTFVSPQTVPTEHATVPGLDGQKMSKSYNNVIGIFDDAATLEKKIMRITTDSKGPTEPKDPNDTIAQLHRLVAPSAADAFDTAYAAGEISYKEAKELLLAATIGFLQPIQERKQALDLNEAEVKQILAEGAERARIVADETIKLVKGRLGLLI